MIWLPVAWPALCAVWTVYAWTITARWLNGG